VKAKTASQKRKTGFVSQHIEIGAKEVPNPDWSRDHDGAVANPRKIMVSINIKESAIAVLESRGYLHPAQVEAADRFRRLYEAAGGSGAKAMDYTKEPVDGGGTAEPISLRRMQAGIELKRCRELLGARGYQIVSALAGEGRSIEEIAGHRQRDKYSLTDALRGFLEDLAVMWRYSNYAQPDRVVVRK
jgi:hypothetical protein